MMFNELRTALQIGGALSFLLVVGEFAVSGAEPSAPAADPIAARLVTEVPSDFPHFSFAADGADAQLLTHYLWYHFHHRLGNGLTLFNKEYLLCADIYSDGRQGTTLQGGGMCGGLGIDYEFFESSLLPAVVVYGFLGLDAQPGNRLAITPQLPDKCPEMAVTDALYHGVLLDFRAGPATIEITCKKRPPDPIHLVLPGTWQRQGSDERGATFDLARAGTHRFKRCD